MFKGSMLAGIALGIAVIGMVKVWPKGVARAALHGSARSATQYHNRHSSELDPQIVRALEESVVEMRRHLPIKVDEVTWIVGVSSNNYDLIFDQTLREDFSRVGYSTIQARLFAQMQNHSCENLRHILDAGVRFTSKVTDIRSVGMTIRVTRADCG